MCETESEIKRSLVIYPLLGYGSDVGELGLAERKAGTAGGLD